MPANLTPQYRSAEKEFRAALTTEEKTRCLQKMIQLLPKHKGTDHLHGDLKRKLSHLKIEGKKKGSRKTPSYYVPKEGAGQVILTGAPNAGKSQILAALTRANVEVAQYPFATHTTAPGMMAYKDIQIQLVDTPPISAQYMESWMPDVIRRGDAALIVVDLGSDDSLEQAEVVLQRLAAVKIVLQGELPAEEAAEPGVTYRRSMVIGNKLDLPGAEERMNVLRELYAGRLPMTAISAAEGLGLDEFGQRVFDLLRLIRVYTRAPGRKSGLGDPFALPIGSAVLDLAAAIHKELAHSIKRARIWGHGVYDGQLVKLDHVLADGDVVELHR